MNHPFSRLVANLGTSVVALLTVSALLTGCSSSSSSSGTQLGYLRFLNAAEDTIKVRWLIEDDGVNEKISDIQYGQVSSRKSRSTGDYTSLFWHVDSNNELRDPFELGQDTSELGHLDYLTYVMTGTATAPELLAITTPTPTFDEDISVVQFVHAHNNYGNLLIDLDYLDTLEDGEVDPSFDLVVSAKDYTSSFSVSSGDWRIRISLEDEPETVLFDSGETHFPIFKVRIMAIVGKSDSFDIQLIAANDAGTEVIADNSADVNARFVAAASEKLVVDLAEDCPLNTVEIVENSADKTCYVAIDVDVYLNDIADDTSLPAGAYDNGSSVVLTEPVLASVGYGEVATLPVTNSDVEYVLTVTPAKAGTIYDGQTIDYFFQSDWQPTGAHPELFALYTKVLIEEVEAEDDMDGNGVSTQIPVQQITTQSGDIKTEWLAYTTATITDAARIQILNTDPQIIDAYLQNSAGNILSLENAIDLQTEPVTDVAPDDYTLWLVPEGTLQEIDEETDVDAAIEALNNNSLLADTSIEISVEIDKLYSLTLLSTTQPVADDSEHYQVAVELGGDFSNDG